MEKVAAARYKASRLVELPKELTIDIVSRVVAQLEDTMEDLRNLHATYKVMCMVCSAATVGQGLHLKRVLQRRFNLSLEFHVALITTLATIGNPEALFHSGLCLTLLGNKRGVIMTFLNQLR
jgi:hypothetical protein